MSNVIHVNFPTRDARRAGALVPLVRGFSTSRRSYNDVMWLKENGELLNILESTGASLPHESLALYEPVYKEIAQRLAFFPQYYRFILSIALDLEALGMPGNRAEQMCDWIVRQDLVGGETSDIQRLEARRLLARRDRTPEGDDPALEDRMRRFIESPERFALPNKKAAYELTHIVFYLSEYGRKDPEIGQNGIRSLENAGICAFLDGNSDLLAEICIAMRYAKYNPSVIWEDWIAQQMNNSSLHMDHALSVRDDYHGVFMGAWLGSMLGGEGLASLQPTGDGAVPVLTMADDNVCALREMSRQLLTLGNDRCADWHTMRPQLESKLSDEANAIIAVAECASGGFAQFFESFARTSQVGSA